MPSILFYFLLLFYVYLRFISNLNLHIRQNKCFLNQSSVRTLRKSLGFSTELIMTGLYFDNPS